jgi:hypothetical protein
VLPSISNGKSPTSGVTIRTGGSDDFADPRFERPFLSPDVIPRICARKLSLHPNNPVPKSAALRKKFLRELLMDRSPEFLFKYWLQIDAFRIPVGNKF